MKKYIFLFLLCSLGQAFVYAQEGVSFTSSISTDSILLGNYVEVKFRLENVEVETFYPPEFEGFERLSGPNTATSMSIINGATSRSTTYTYLIKPLDVGDYFIPPAAVETRDGVLESEPIAVLVVPNPDGVIQKPQEQEPIFGGDFFGRNPFDDPFFKRRPFDDPFFRSPSDSMPPPPQETKPKKKKRKITRI